MSLIEPSAAHSAYPKLTCCWTPPPQWLLNSHMTRFARHVAAARNRRDVVRNLTPGECDLVSRWNADLMVSPKPQQYLLFGSRCPPKTTSPPPKDTVCLGSTFLMRLNAPHYFTSAHAHAYNMTANYPALFEYSVDHPNLFWMDVLTYCRIKYTSAPVALLRKPPLAGGLQSLNLSIADPRVTLCCVVQFLSRIIRSRVMSNCPSETIIAFVTSAIADFFCVPDHILTPPNCNTKIYDGSVPGGFQKHNASRREITSFAPRIIAFRSIRSIDNNNSALASPCTYAFTDNPESATVALAHLNRLVTISSSNKAFLNDSKCCLSASESAAPLHEKKKEIVATMQKVLTGTAIPLNPLLLSLTLHDRFYDFDSQYPLGNNSVQSVGGRNGNTTGNRISSDPHNISDDNDLPAHNNYEPVPAQPRVSVRLDSSASCTDVTKLEKFQAPKMDLLCEWFPGMRLNYAQNILRFGEPESVTKNNIAVYFATEDSAQAARVFTFAELRKASVRFAAALRAAGVGVGDRVAGYIATCPEALVALLGTAAVGAIWTSASPDFGVSGVLDRFIQVNPTVLIATNAVFYNGRLHSQLDNVRDVANGLRSASDSNLRRVILVSLRPEVADYSKDIPFCTRYADFVKINNIETNQKEKIAEWQQKSKSSDFYNGAGCLTKEVMLDEFADAFTPVPFNQPLYIVFSSGTTGKPKGIVHSAGGTLLQHLKEHMIHGNLGPGDAMLQYTTTGWMMWQWMVSALGAGCALVLYDGSPFKPSPDRLLKVLAETNATVFGTSAKYLATLEDHVRAGMCQPLEAYNLKSLHSIYSTGSPLSPESYDFVYESLGCYKRGSRDNLGGPVAPMLASITGGTDILSLFIGHNSNLPVYRGQLQAACLGMKMAAYSDTPDRLTGSRRLPPNEQGDLVCEQLFPIMPLCFWNDDHKNSMYRAAYFSKYPNVWAHGDHVHFVTCPAGIDAAAGAVQGAVMLGRSDGTLNPAGVRFGSSELYNILESDPRLRAEIEDGLAVGQIIPSMRGEERVCMFLKMRPGFGLTPDLQTHLCSVIRKRLSARHVPVLIAAVSDIPYTINNKKVEVIVKRIISGDPAAIEAAKSALTAKPAQSLSSLRNPESLAQFVQFSIL